MPIFNEPLDANTSPSNESGYVFSLADSFSRRIPVTSIEFNPPPVSCLEKQTAIYWQQLNEPDEEDLKTLKSLKSKLRAVTRCRGAGTFISITDSAAGILRMHNTAMVQLLGDVAFTERWLDLPPVIWEPQRTIIHLTRNHSIAWLRNFLDTLEKLSFNNLLLITGDPLKEVRLKTVTAEDALQKSGLEAQELRLKNSVELLKFISNQAPDLHLGAAHNPFMKREVAQKHLMKKVDAGAGFLVTQPVSYYDECWQVMAEFDAFYQQNNLSLPVILGVFNYAVPVGKNGYREEIFLKRYKFWKRLFGFVPEGVREDYDRGLDGTEILARSINKLIRMGHYHFDIMNAEKNGWSVLRNRQRLTHEFDRITGTFD